MPSLIWLLQLISLDLLSKLGDVSGVTPRLQLLLLANRCSKTPQPSVPQIRCIHLVPRLLVDDLSKALDIWMLTNVVIDRRQLDQLTEESDVTLSAEILMTNYSLAYCFGLVLGRAVVLEEIERLDTTLELEREAGGGHVCISCADVMEETRESKSRG